MSPKEIKIRSLLNSKTSPSSTTVNQATPDEDQNQNQDETLNRLSTAGQIVSRLSKLKMVENQIEGLPCVHDIPKTDSTTSISDVNVVAFYGKNKIEIYRDIMTRILYYIVRFQDHVVDAQMTEEYFKDRRDRSTVVDPGFEKSVTEFLMRHVDHPILYETIGSLTSYPAVNSCFLYQQDEHRQMIELIRLAREGQFRIIRHLFIERGTSKGWDREKRQFMWKIRFTADSLERISRRVPKYLLGEILEAQIHDQNLVQIEQAEQDMLKKKGKELKKNKGKVAEVRKEEQEYNRFVKMRKEYIALYHQHRDNSKTGTTTTNGEGDSSSSQTQDNHSSCTSDVDYKSWDQFATLLRQALSHLVTLSSQYLPNSLNKHHDTVFESMFWILVRHFDKNKILIPKDPSLSIDSTRTSEEESKDNNNDTLDDADKSVFDPSSVWWKRETLPSIDFLESFLNNYYVV